MTVDKSQTVLIALGVSLLTVVLVPVLVCLAMMLGGMGSMRGMMGDSHMMGTSMMAGGLVVLLTVIAGIVSLTRGLRTS
jgi:hypothetical protein